MKIIYADSTLVLRDNVVVLGNFDGVHIAHRALIKEAVEIARINNYQVVVYTFDEHPRRFFGSEIPLLTTNAEKEKIFSELGVDVLVYQKLSYEFLSMSPIMFIESVVVNRLGAKKIVVGKHYTFGAKASGNVELLSKIAEKFGVLTHVEELIKIDDCLISSSNIRKCLLEGNPEMAAQMLGRCFAITGNVVHGNHIGSEIGFPTANVFFEGDKIVPKYGVYACKVLIENKEFYAVVNIGVKPTVGTDKPLAEAHILDVEHNLYNKIATIKLCSFLREEKKFNNINELKKQIEIDVDLVREYFPNHLE